MVSSTQSVRKDGTRSSLLARLPPFAMKQWQYVALSGILLVFATLAFVPPPPLAEQANMAHAPVFQIPRKENGRVFALDHIERGPILYVWLHTAPAVVWSLLMPVQHVQRIRRDYPTVHRISGRISVLMSLVLSITGALLPFRDLIYSAPTFHLHRFRVGTDPSITLLVWPSFRLSVFLVSPLVAWTAVQTIRTARAKQWQDHRWWAGALTWAGYWVPMQRVMIVIFNVVALIVPYLTAAQRAFSHIPNDNSTIQAKSQVETAAFAWTVWSALAVMVVYWWRLQRQNFPVTTAKVASQQN